MGVANKVNEAGLILGALGVIGFLGIIWLMIYGNLSGNLGFQQDSLSFSNETILLSEVAAIPAGAQGRVDGLISSSSVVMTNATGGEIIEAGNYTLSSVSFVNATTTYGGQNVNVSYTVSFDSASDIQAEDVINNITSGFGTFFTFSETFFTIAAIVLLIFMLIGLLALAMQIARGKSSKRGSLSDN